jgi:hypothetical protein
MASHWHAKYWIESAQNCRSVWGLTLLIGLRAFKRAQLSLKITVRTLTRPWIAQLSRNRRAVENGRRRADYDSVLSSLGDVLRGLPERSRSLTVLAFLWRFKSQDITLCETPNWSAILRRLNPVFRMPMTCHFCSSVNSEMTEHYRNQLVVVHFRLHVDYATTGRFMAVWVYELLSSDSIAHV